MPRLSYRQRLAVLLFCVAQPVLAQGSDSALVRVQRLVNAGNRGAARALADSLLVLAPDGSPEYAEALYARAFSSSGAAEAERDYLRVSIEYPFSPRAEDAIMMVAQLKMARTDRMGARRNFERLVREHPDGTQSAKAAFWAGRLALEDGDIGSGCASLVQARERVAPSDVELSNQIAYYVQRCASTRATPTRDPVTAPPPETVPVGVPNAPPATPVSVVSKLYSVQVAAFPKQRDAVALSEVLQGRGFDVRVWGTAPPFRVRVGHYATREDAVSAVARMKASRVNGIVVEAEPK